MKRILYYISVAIVWLAAASSCFAEFPMGGLAHTAGEMGLAAKQVDEYNKACGIFFSMLASAGAYVPENSTEMKYLHYYGWEFTPHRATVGKTVVHYITAKGKVMDGTPLYVVSFRGSVDKKDWTTDLTTAQVVYGGNSLEESEKIAGILGRNPDGIDTEVADAGNGTSRPAMDTGLQEEKKESGKTTLPSVHKGFNSYADAALRALLEPSGFLEQYRAETGARLLLTGHSLGGAVAALVGQRLIDFGFDPARLQVITFGAPAIGNKVFAQEYGSRMNLIRVTNTQDPIPLTMQAVLRNYKQFGEEVRFRIPKTFNNVNHVLNLYLDFGLRYYYNTFDKAVAYGIVREWPDAGQSVPGKPVVLLHVKRDEAARLKETAAVLERFMLNEYRRLLPNYIIAPPGSDPYETMRESGADYLLLLEFAAVPSRENNSWYLTLEQTLSDKEGKVLAVGSVTKHTSPLAGNILAAMEAVEIQREELLRHMPWLTGAGSVKQ